MVQVIRQAHLPGTYELSEPESNTLGPVICKTCSDRHGKQTAGALHTVWIAIEDWEMVWWLCRDHADKASVESTGQATVPEKCPRYGSHTYHILIFRSIPKGHHGKGTRGALACLGLMINVRVGAEDSIKEWLELAFANSITHYAQGVKQPDPQT
jgi:hypothetical protein